MHALHKTRIRTTDHATLLLPFLLLSLSMLLAPRVTTAAYAVQVGAFVNPANAHRFSDRLESQGFRTTTLTDHSGGEPLLLVQVGPYPDHDTAVRAHEKLDKNGIRGLLVAANTEDDPAPASMDDLFVDPSDSGDKPGTTPDDPLTGDSLFVDTGEEQAPPRVSGFFQSELAYTYQSPTHPSKFRNILQLESDGTLQNDISWRASVRGFYDGVFHLTDHYSSRVENNREYEAEIYETYLDFSAADLDFRVGRQNIIWGEMVGLFFADVVSAKDLRQFVAQDFDMIRIPHWAARAEHYRGDFHAEAIWIPYMTYNEIGKPGDDFYPLPERVPGFVTKYRAVDQPTRDLENSAYGLRLSYLMSGWDVSAFYYRSVDANPAFFRQIQAGPTPTIIYKPDHDKIHQFGLTLGKDFRNFVLKSEVIFTKDRWYMVDDINDSDGVTRQDTLDYVVGMENTLSDGTLLNFQFFQRWYTDHESDILFDELESGASIYASRKFLNNKLEPEFLFISGLNREDWMARPRLNWYVDDNWWLTFGADIFGGEEKSLFGRYDDSDRVYANVRYVF